MNRENTLSFLRDTALRVVVLALLIQAIAFYGFSRTEYTPSVAPLASFPTVIGPYRLASENVVEQEIREVLKADDLLTRNYVGPDIVPVNLFIAAFRTQRTGKGPHSPKNCLPGDGWSQLVNEQMMIDLPGLGPEKVNHYVVAKGSERSAVIYWYQSRDRIVGTEYAAKFYSLADSIRYNRSDTAIVRVVVPVLNGDQETADRRAIDFIHAAFPAIREALPR